MHDSDRRDATGAEPTVSRRRYLATASAIGATAVLAKQGASSGVAPEPIDDREWTLEWSDEFEDGVDSDVWSYAVGNGHDEGIPGWGNEELQYYTEGENATVEDEALVIEAREEHASDEHGTYDYTSSRLLTAGNREFEGGRIDVRATLPEGQGIWPAIWLLGADIDEVGWPDCGEIDLMELVGHEPDTVHGTIHGPGYSAGEAIGGDYSLDSGTFSEGPHTFSIVWDPDERIQWYVDGEQYFEVTRQDVEAHAAEWVFDGPFYLLVNVAVGGLWPGYPDETTEFPQQMAVEYVRAYSEGTDEGPCEAAGAASGETVNGHTVCDLNGDGHYRDVNGDGTLTNGDVTTFFEHQHTPAWNERTDLFDFTEDGNVGQADVIDLFGHI